MGELFRYRFLCLSLFPFRIPNSAFPLVAPEVQNG